MSSFIPIKLLNACIKHLVNIVRKVSFMFGPFLCRKPVLTRNHNHGGPPSESNLLLFDCWIQRTGISLNSLISFFAELFMPSLKEVTAVSLTSSLNEETAVSLPSSLKEVAAESIFPSLKDVVQLNCSVPCKMFLDELGDLCRRKKLHCKDLGVNKANINDYEVEFLCDYRKTKVSCQCYNTRRKRRLT